MMSSTTIKLLVGLLIVELIKKPNNIEVYSEDNYDNLIIIEVLKYIDNNYSTATLFEISEIVNQRHYKISKLVKKHTNMTFKELLQEKRLNKAKQLLNETDISIVEIIYLVGYEENQIVTYVNKLMKEFKHLPYEYGASMGYFMIKSESTTIDDAINEALIKMRENKGE